MIWIATSVQSQLRALEENEKVPLLRVLSFFAATVTSKDESTLASTLMYIIGRCSNSDLEWLVQKVSEKLSKLDG